MGAGLLMVALLDGFVRFLIPGAAIVGGVLALVAWSERRPWAGIKAAGLWLLAPWGVLVLFDMVEGGGVGILFAVNKNRLHETSGSGAGCRDTRGGGRPDSLDCGRR